VVNETTKVHYFFDPLCGWCYGATTLANELDQAPNVQLILQPAGMLQRQTMSTPFREMVKVHDQRIETVTGQVFGQPYQERLLSSESIWLDSYITAQAILLVEQLSGQGFSMLQAVQQAHYQLGLDVSKQETLTKLALSFGVGAKSWFALLDNNLNQSNQQAQLRPIKQAVAHSNELMARCQVQGLPSFAIEHQGQFTPLEHSRYYAKSAQWQQLIQQL